VAAMSATGGERDPNLSLPRPHRRSKAEYESARLLYVATTPRAIDCHLLGCSKRFPESTVIPEVCFGRCSASISSFPAPAAATDAAAAKSERMIARLPSAGLLLSPRRSRLAARNLEAVESRSHPSSGWATHSGTPEPFLHRSSTGPQMWERGGSEPSVAKPGRTATEGCRGHR